MTLEKDSFKIIKHGSSTFLQADIPYVALKKVFPVLTYNISAEIEAITV